MAVGARAAPRVTADVDFAIDVSTDEEAEALVHRLMQLGWRVDATLEHTSGRLATVRLQHDTSKPVLVDLLFHFSGIEHETVDSATPLAVLGRRVNVATVSYLIAMKLLAARDKDLADLGALLEGAPKSTIASARSALRLAEQRGFDDGRNLLSELDALARRARETTQRFRPSARRFKRPRSHR